MANWLTLHPKFVAAFLTAAVIYILSKSGVDIGPLWQQISPLIAAYLAPSSTGATNG